MYPPGIVSRRGRTSHRPPNGTSAPARSCAWSSWGTALVATDTDCSRAPAHHNRNMRRELIKSQNQVSAVTSHRIHSRRHYLRSNRANEAWNARFISIHKSTVNSTPNTKNRKLLKMEYQTLRTGAKVQHILTFCAPKLAPREASAHSPVSKVEWNPQAWRPAVGLPPSHPLQH